LDKCGKGKKKGKKKLREGVGGGKKTPPHQGGGGGGWRKGPAPPAFGLGPGKGRKELEKDWESRALTNVSICLLLRLGLPQREKNGGKEPEHQKKRKLVGYGEDVGGEKKTIDRCCCEKPKGEKGSKNLPKGGLSKKVGPGGGAKKTTKEASPSGEPKGKEAENSWIKTVQGKPGKKKEEKEFATRGKRTTVV